MASRSSVPASRWVDITAWPASSTSGRSIAARTRSKTKASSSSANVALWASRMLATGPEGIVIMAIVIIVEGPIASAHLVTRHAHGTVAALDEPAQQPVFRVRATRAPFGVVIAHALRGLEELLIDDCGHRYRDPLVPGTPYLTLGPGRASAQDKGCPVVVCATPVRLIAYQAPDRGHAPDGLAGWRGDKVLVELPTDLPQRQIALDIVLKDAPHDGRLWFVDLEMRAPLAAARDASIAVGALPGDDLAGTRAPEFAATISLGDLGALILGNHALHLSE